MKHFIIIAVTSILMTSDLAGITIDGALSEPEWKNAQKFTFEAGDPPFEVTALVLWDETNFYFGCTAPDPTVEGQHQSGIQNVWEDNGIEFYLETDNAKFEGRSDKSFQLLFSAAGAYNDTGGKGNGGNGDYDFAWDSHIEYVVALESGTTLNDDSDQDKGWRLESRLPWSDMNLNGSTILSNVMGFNVIYVNRDGGASAAFSWAPDVAGFANNHMANNWGEITFVEGHLTQTPTGNPVELGQTVNGYQDDFTGATRNPDWQAFGPGGDHYVQADGLLYVSPSVGDPNHLLYMKAGYTNDVQEVLARIRATAFGPMHDYPRGGVAVAVQANPTNLLANPGYNLHFRDSTQDSVPSRQFKLLDDARAWGPAGLRTNVPPQTTPGWTNNVWYWLRLRNAPKEDGTNNLYGKVWVADGVTAEPTDWQLKWADTPLPKPLRTGFAGIAGSSVDGSNNGLGHFEVDYILIKAAGLPEINVNFSPTGPPTTAPRITGITKIASNKVQIEWIGEGTLEQADSVAGPYAPVPASSALGVITTSATAKYYRLR